MTESIPSPVNHVIINIKQFGLTRMPESVTQRIKYIYLDVVGFTYNRTVESQAQIVSALNAIVKKIIANSFPELDVIYIPIGDGICICLLNSTVIDDYIIIAQEIIRIINAVHNPSVKQTLRFQIRIGINENVDNIVTDINGNRNVCGSGVNDAQRIMSFGDSNHILVGRTVADSLMPREKYSTAFQHYVAKTKHDTTIEVYQYKGLGVADLNRNPPRLLAPQPEKTLTEDAAYYMATLLRNREFIETTIQQEPYLLWHLALQMAYLAEDSLGHSKETKYMPYDDRISETPNGTLQEQFQLFSNLPWSVAIDLHDAKVLTKFYNYLDCFELRSQCLVVSKKGEQKLNNEWPDLYKQISTN